MQTQAQTQAQARTEAQTQAQAETQAQARTESQTQAQAQAHIQLKTRAPDTALLVQARRPRVHVAPGGSSIVCADHKRSKLRKSKFS